ncbi:IS1 family transposase (plasmid) [Klebsiella pneumoniae]
MASVSVCCPSCSATEGVMRNGKRALLQIAGGDKLIIPFC